VPGRDSGSGAQEQRSAAPSLASVLRSLTPTERRYVVGIASLTPLQVWAAFGTSPTPPVPQRGSANPPAGRATKSKSLALPILPTCGPGPCWRGASSPGRPR
jgi:hypothetical protein